ncbi:acyloxyacyl hydrolase [Spirosoma sp.]|uniref:acyloxyacyl hydrolase n=2 Tax=unclassified Spirosoma TaxID=2621999 RepID=UPI000A9BBDA7|nr:acyloxyacyl hydrolase [Spirosoma sp.]
MRFQQGTYMFRLAFIGVTVALCTLSIALGQVNEATDEREVGLNLLAGLYVSSRIVPIATQAPVGFELRYNRMHTSQQAWEQCHCLYRSGAFLNAYSFRNPIALGQSVGAGLFFEPLLLHRVRWDVSVRALAGITYVSRSYDAVTNPGNRAFGTPVNGLIGTGLFSRYAISSHWKILAGFDYKHISNAGVRLPNEGLNIPSATVGLTYYTGKAVLSPRYSHVSESGKRWMVRGLAMASVKVLEATDKEPERGYPIFGLNFIGGYHLTQAHVISGGIELLDDRYFKEQILRWTGHYQPYRQVTVLGGYEFWQGHFAFTAHMGWNVVRPFGYKPATYQKYGLLYRFASGFTTGVAVKAYGENTKNFQALVGMTL